MNRLLFPWITTKTLVAFDVNQIINENNDSILMNLYSLGHYDLVIAVLNRPDLYPVNINHSNSQGTTLLHQAVINHKNELGKIIIHYSGVDINLQDKDGCTPIMRAISNNNLDLFYELFLDPRLNINLTSVTGETLGNYALNMIGQYPYRDYWNAVLAVLCRGKLNRDKKMRPEAIWFLAIYGPGIDEFKRRRILVSKELKYIPSGIISKIFCRSKHNLSYSGSIMPVYTFPGGEIFQRTVEQINTLDFDIPL